MAEETPKEKYERLQRDVQKEILTAYPNPTRKGCPGNAVVKQVAERRDNITDEPWEHHYPLFPLLCGVPRAEGSGSSGGSETEDIFPVPNGGGGMPYHCGGGDSDNLESINAGTLEQC